MLTLFVLAHWGHHLLSSSVPPLLPFIRSSLNIDVAQAGGLVSAFTIAYGVSQLPAGWLADRIGRRALIALGVSGAALCGFLLGIAPTYGMMVTLMVLMGLFGGGYHPASAPLVTSLVEPKRRGWALGIHQIGGTASNLSAPLIAAALASSYLGWKSAFMIPGAVVFVLGIVLYLLTGADRQTVKAPVSAGGHGKVEPPEPQHSRSNLITYLTIGTFGQVFIGSVISFLPLFIVDRLGESAAIGAALQAVVYLGGLPAGPLAGYFADRVGPRRMLIVAGVVTGPVIYLLTQVTSVWTSIPIFLSLGALMFVLMPVSEIYLINQTPETNRSTAMGVYYACSRGGSGFLILGVGYLIKHLGFSPTFAITGIALLVIVVACLVFLWYQRKSALVNKV
ncbi:MAG: hypothetical protein HW402_1376 [Dehalococcoidales bacterium]|nr:hypothetical protein [Dehalococcoidales bacterium]